MGKHTAPRGRHEAPRRQSGHQLKEVKASCVMVGLTLAGQGVDMLVNRLQYFSSSEMHSAPVVAGIGLAAGGATLHAARVEMVPGRARKMAAAVGAVAGAAIAGYMGHRYGWAPPTVAGEAMVAAGGAVTGAAVGYEYPRIAIDYPQLEAAPAVEPDDRLTPDEVAAIFKRAPVVAAEETLFRAVPSGE